MHVLTMQHLTLISGFLHGLRHSILVYDVIVFVVKNGIVGCCVKSGCKH